MHRHQRLHRLICFILVIIATLASLCFGPAAPAEAAVNAAPAEHGRRVALVIGNSTYKSLPSLPNPANDVQHVSEVLRASGFDVTMGVNVDRLALEDTVRQFLRSTHDAEAALVYYSGHGIQVGGQNFLVPVDATLETAYDVETQTMPLDLIFNHLKQNSRVQLIFLDACRNNPFKSDKFWMAETLQPVGATRGLARIDSNLGSLIAFSTEPGQVALDGSGTLSPYSESFIKRVSEPAKEIRQTLTEVRRDVIAATQGKQVPWENSSLTDSFYFRPAPPPPAVPAMQQVSVAAGAAAAPLHVAEPHDATGSTLKVTLNQIPQTGKITLAGKPLSAGAELDVAALSKLSYDATGVNAGTLGLVSYTVSDPYGQSSQGLVAITVAADTAAEQKKLELARTARHDDAVAYVNGLGRDVAARVGVGPVGADLAKAPATLADLHLKVSALPEKGIVRAGDRVIGPGHVIDANDLPKLSFEPQVGTDGKSYPLTLAATEDGIPAATVTFKPELDPCDQAAAAPLDLQGVTTGKLPNEIDPATAIKACTDAVKAYPGVSRFAYQLGRAQLANRQADLAGKSMQKAINGGHIRAMEQLANLYALGAVGKADAAKATETLRPASDKGDPYALYSLGKALYYGQGAKQDTAKGLELMLKAADLGHTYAMNELGYIFLNGVNITADPARAIHFYEAGVERNDIYSMNNLALAYRNGKGVAVDNAKAIDLFTRAAEGGQPYAPTNLGRMYRDGDGVGRDLSAAVKWLEMGADRGDYWGALDRGRLAASADAGTPDNVTAARFYALAAALDRPETGDADKQAEKALAALPAADKKKAFEIMFRDLSAKARKEAARGKYSDVKLIGLAKAAWVERHPRYDLF